MDRLDELAVFVAIIDAGSLAAAARRLRRSPPAVTRALARLEERLNSRLVVRTTRRLSPTAEGRELVERARRLLADYDATVQDAASAPIRGLLRVTAPLVFGRRHVTPLVADFLDLHPGLQIELELNDRNVDLVDQDVHVAVRIGLLADSSLIARRVGEVRQIVVAAPDYLTRKGAPRKPRDLHRHDIIFGFGVSSTPEWRFGPGERGAVIRITPRLRVNEVEAMLSVIRAGRGVGRALSYQVADEIAAGSLVRLLPDFEPPPLPVQLVIPGGRHMPARVRAFLDHAALGLEKLAVIRRKAAPDRPLAVDR